MQKQIITRSISAGGPEKRIEALDFARGVAIVLMILSHGVKGLLDFNQIPDFGLVPIHLVTKFSSTLFIMVFGMSLAVAYLPHVATDQWKQKRKRLLIRSLVVFFWYKLLTIVEMSHLNSPQEIIEALTYKRFPVFVEILGFYAIALLWVPFFLPVWKKMSLLLRLLTPVLFAALAVFLHQNCSFFNLKPLQAVLTEADGYYTWGQLSRGPLIFLGLILGDIIAVNYVTTKRRYYLAAVFSALSFLLLLLFYLRTADIFHKALIAIAKNEGKHPPELNFILFSLGGSLLIMAAGILLHGRLAVFARPIIVIGKDALQSFIFHIFVLFVFYRYLFNYWHNISYTSALVLSGLLILLTACWVRALSWIRRNS